MRTSGRAAAGAAKKQNRPAAAKSAKKRAGTVKKDPATRRTAGKNSAGKGVRRSGAVRYETAERQRERQRRKVSEKPQSEYSEESLLTQGREQYRMSMFLTFLVVIVLLIVVGVNAISLGRRLVENKKNQDGKGTHGGYRRIPPVYSDGCLYRRNRQGETGLDL